MQRNVTYFTRGDKCFVDSKFFDFEVGNESWHECFAIDGGEYFDLFFGSSFEITKYTRGSIFFIYFRERLFVFGDYIGCLCLYSLVVWKKLGALFSKNLSIPDFSDSFVVLEKWFFDSMNFLVYMRKERIVCFEMFEENPDLVKITILVGFFGDTFFAKSKIVLICVTK